MKVYVAQICTAEECEAILEDGDFALDEPLFTSVYVGSFDERALDTLKVRTVQLLIDQLEDVGEDPASVQTFEWTGGNEECAYLYPIRTVRRWSLMDRQGQERASIAVVEAEAEA